MHHVTLTFDNGPHPEITPRVLDVLASRGVTAHFFVLGKHLTGGPGPGLVARARDAGHLIGNHSFSHAIALGDDPRADAVDREIAATEALLAPIVPGAKRFRPFGKGGVLGRHLLSGRAVDYLVAHGYSCVLWNSVPHDWINPDGWAPRALADCASRRHTVVVLHDIPNACLTHLAEFIDTARDRGAQFVSALPGDCAPIIDGRIVSNLGAIVSPADLS